VLWEKKLDNMPSSGIVTYRIKDKQYLAVVVGMHNFHVDGIARSLDRLLAGDAASSASGAAAAAPRPNPNPAAIREALAKAEATRGGAAIWVFSL
jgi:hypothetical protein